MSNWPDVTVALVSALSGGVLIKFTERWLDRNQKRNEQEKLKRDELRGETSVLQTRIDQLRTENRAVEKEIDEFKEKYWKIYSEYQQFKVTVFGILIKNGIKPSDFFPNEFRDI